MEVREDKTKKKLHRLDLLLTEEDNQLLGKAARQKEWSKAQVIRQALHFWFSDRQIQ